MNINIFRQFFMPDNAQENYAFFRRVNTSSATRRLVIPDVHGCSLSLLKLLEQIQLEKTDYLFFLGDYIDKGVDSKGVLDIVIDLMKAGYQIYPLKGNHEDMLLESMATEETEDILIHHQGQNLEPLLDTEGNIAKKYADFLLELPYYYELEDFYLVHAGFNFSVEKPFEAYEDMLWIRDFPIDETQLAGKRIIHGHTPTPSQFIKEDIQEESTAFSLDAGAVFYDMLEVGYGQLICLDLDSFQLYEQPNLEQDRL